MIAIRRAAERVHVHDADHDVWHTFHARKRGDPGDVAFGALVAFDEIRFPPGRGSAPHPCDEAEIISYVFKGALAQKDSTGRSGVIHAGEFQRLITGRGFRCGETNASRDDWAHVFRISFSAPEAGLESGQEQKRFVAAERRNALRVIASRDARRGSLRIGSDALVFSGILDRGHHLVHELRPGRCAWVHVLCGEATMQDVVLNQGDGVGVSSEPAASLTVQEKSEILLVDLGAAPGPPGNGVVR